MPTETAAMDETAVGWAPPASAQSSPDADSPPAAARASDLRAMERLIAVVQDLSLARGLGAVTEIVRHAARELTGADGATFVLREGTQCFYADEDAIEPLWKGRRFPLGACISGWVMRHGTPVVLEDIYADTRVPTELYRPTFVKSLAMVPVRTDTPIAAIGNYWAQPHLASTREVGLLQALANSTSVALENVQLYGQLEQRVRERTAQLEAANRELEAFAYSVSHDLRAPLRGIDGFSQVLRERYSAVLDDKGRHYLDRVRSSAQHMGGLIDVMLDLARLSRAALCPADLDLAVMARQIADEQRLRAPERAVDVVIAAAAPARGDPHLMRSVMENLLDNAWKFTARRARARIEFGVGERDGERAYFVRDDGAGFDPDRAERLFTPFHRLHDPAEFEGNGIGLATVHRIVRRHGGRLWAEGATGAGATFWFTLGGAA